MLPFLRFEWRRLFFEKRNLAALGFISLFSAYFGFSGWGEYRQFQTDKEVFLRLEAEKVTQMVTYSQYGGFGFRLLYEAAPLSLFFINSSVLQNVESNIDSLEAIRVSSSFKGDKLFLKRGYFKDFAGVLFVFGSLLMLYLGHLALVSPAYLRFMSGRIPLGRFYAMTTLARLFWLDLFFIVLGLGMFTALRAAGAAFSAPETRVFLLYMLFLLLMLDFLYLLGQLTSVLLRFRPVFFLWLFVAWFACVFLLPEVSRISVFNRSQALQSAEKVNLEKLRNLMALERKFRDYLKVNPSDSLDQIREMQKRFAVQFINSSYLINSVVETKYLREVREVIAGHELQSALFPTTYYPFLTGEASGKGYYGYLEFMEYIMRLRNRFVQFYLRKRYEEPDSPVESFVRKDENVFRSRSRLPRTFWIGLLATALYAAAIAVLAFRSLQRQARP